MKNSLTQTLIIIFSFLIFSTSYAQTFSYTLEVENDIYVDIENATELTSVGDMWDDPDYNIPIGFDFDFYGATYNNVYITDEGYGAWLTFQNTNTAQGPLTYLIPYLDDLVDIEGVNAANQSTISYTTEGVSGEQILKIQWKDCGFYEEMSYWGTANNTISFQLWLFEGSNNIEVRFGPSMLPNAASIHEYGAPVCGIMEELPLGDPDEIEFWYLSGDATNPTLIQSNSDVFDSYSIAGLDSDPVNGQIYRLVNVPTSIKVPIQSLALNVYPTVITDEFFIEVNEETLTEKTQISVVNNLGQIIYNNTITNVKERLNAASFPTGIYYVRIQNENGIGTKKIIKN